MNEAKAYLDDYAVAADKLEESGPAFAAVAASLRDMRQRVIEHFLDAETPRYNLGMVHVIDGWCYATEGRICLRWRTDEPDTNHPEQPPVALIDYFKDWTDEPIECEWLPWEWDKAVETLDGVLAAPIAGRLIYEDFAELIRDKLPEPEYLEDRGGYIGIHDEQPVRFRFRFGQGVIMPMNRERAETQRRSN